MSLEVSEFGLFGKIAENEVKGMVMNSGYVI